MQKYKKLNLYDLATIKQNFEVLLNDRLAEMESFFHQYMWNGWEDENNPLLITDEDLEAIEALTKKIEHMICNIGCPSSVFPMLESICSRKIKRWQGSNSIETDNHTTWVWDNERRKQKIVVQGFKKGKQLKTIDQIARVKKSKGYYNNAGIVLTGHFRWNNRAYILSRRCSDVLQEYLTGSNFLN